MLTDNSAKLTTTSEMLLLMEFGCHHLGAWMFGQAKIWAYQSNFYFGYALFSSKQLLFEEASFSSTQNIKQEFFAQLQLLFQSRTHHFHQQNIYLLRIPCNNLASISVKEG